MPGRLRLLQPQADGTLVPTARGTQTPPACAPSGDGKPRRRS